MAWANTLLTVGVAGIALRPVLPAFLSYFAANVLICLGYVLTLHGIAEFFDIRVGKARLGLLVAAYSAEFAYFFYYAPSFSARLFCYLALYGCIMLRIVWITFGGYRKTRAQSHLVGAGVAGFLATSFLACAAISLLHREGKDILTLTALNAAVLLEQIVFVIGWTLSFTLMVSERLSSEKARAELASGEKSDALANMSHELRTPLNAIIGFADVIDSEALGPGNPKYRDYIKDILASGRYLLLLIEDILDVSRIEAGKLTLRETWIPVPDLFASVLRLVAHRAAADKVAITTEIADSFRWVVGDELRLRQILLNLVTNAIKFTPAGGRVLLNAARLDDGSGSLTVADTGIGMDAAGIERALTKYCQVEDAYTRRREGIGLGLPLAVALTDAHGGRLTVASTPGEGTTMTVILPPERCRQQGVTAPA